MLCLNHFYARLVLCEDSVTKIVKKQFSEKDFHSLGRSKELISLEETLFLSKFVKDGGP